MNNALRKNIKGSALVYGLVIMTAVAIILTSILTFITSQTKYALRIHSREQAFQIAESGIDFYRWYLAHQVEGRTAQQVATFWTSGNPYGVGSPYEFEYTDGGVGIGKYKLTVTSPKAGSTSITVKSEGWTYRNSTDVRTLVVRLRRPSWSENAVLANDFMRFGEGTEVFGKIMSNKGIRFDGLAHNVISSAVATYDDPDHNDHKEEFGVHTHLGTVDPLPPAAVPARTDVFEAGRAFPVATIDFNGVLGDLSFMKSEAQAGANGNRYFDNSGQGRHIILKTDGTFDIRTVKSFVASTNEINNYSGGWQTYTIPNDGIIYVENNVWLEGTVNGKRVTIVAANLINSSKKTMYLGKDIRYTNHDCSDMIGLIGQQDVEIYRGSNNMLYLDAALIAQTGRVGRANYTGTFALRNTITIFGSIASNQRYGFAWIDSLGNHVSGYQNRDLYYDNNLLYCPPPYFPTGTQYQMDLWEEQ